MTNPKINRQLPPSSVLNKHRGGVSNAEETLDVALQRSLVTSVGDFDHRRFQIRRTMRDGEGPAPSSNQREEEKRVK